MLLVGPAGDEPAEQDGQQHVNARLLEAPGETDDRSGEREAQGQKVSPGALVQQEARNDEHHQGVLHVGDPLDVHAASHRRPPG